ncbi:MAG TPA: alpha/beta fold hydrolase [Allosphingosinicella sp.]|nr:alpha/beta fold hydrolase [Allosphingosinicella sp.]
MHRLAAFAMLIAAAAPAAAQQSSELAIGPADHQLRGTLLVPQSPARDAEPVLILAGSGPTDRDGNSPMGVAAQPYRLLAEALAARGIATLRVDKRGIAASAAAGRSETELRLQHFADDAHAWAAELRRRTHARCVWLLGHSEGTLHALLAAQDPRDLCGIILISSVGRKLGDIIRQQLETPANAPVREEALRILAELEAGRTVPGEGMNPLLAPLFRPSVQPFVMSMLAADPPALARAYRGPILVVQGTTDLQTRVADAEALGAARPGITVRIIEGMNHVLKTAPADLAANAATYRDPALPLAPGLVDAIAGFIGPN